MAENHMDGALAAKTFTFLKKALSTGDKETTFQPRGPKELSDGRWSYQCRIEGTIEKFSGHETISYNDKIVFTHDFFGGIVIAG
jgi:Domain of unknown function (DUF5680)